jgi:multimeric flavodoxin WrbA
VQHQGRLPSPARELKSADGIILSSPNYMSGVTAQLKTVFDRSVNCEHEQYLTGKYGFSIMTAGGVDEDLLLGIMNGFIKESGGTVISSVGLLMNRGPAAMEAAIKRAHDMGRDLVEAIEEKRVYPEQVAEHEAWRKQFARTIEANKERWSHNYEFWEKKGWLEP